ncbi:MAG: hypothetical protein ACREE7_11295 [Dongiaceae bacterium]
MTKQQKAWAESLLVAYVDGELDPTQATQVEATIRGDPEAQAIVGVLRSSARAVRAAFDQPLAEPVPERLRRLFEMPDSDRVVPWHAVAQRIRQRALLPLAASLAALAIGFGAGALTFGGSDGAIRPAATGDSASAFEETLYRVLESGDPTARLSYGDPATGQRGTVALGGTIADEFGDCREFRHEAADAVTKGIACRAADGSWSVLSVPAS